MSGDDDKVNKMIEDCYKGPMFARVDKISFLIKMNNYFLPQIVEGKFVRI